MNMCRESGALSRKLAKSVWKSQMSTVSMAFTSLKNTSEGRSPLLIMHAFLGCKEHWHNFSKSIHKATKGTRTIIAADARNHGDSPNTDAHSYELMAEDTKVFLEQRKIKKSCLLGHSMGGNAAMYFAINYPNLVEKVIIEDISPIRPSSLVGKIPSFLTAMGKVTIPSNVSLIEARNKVDEQLVKSIPYAYVRSNFIKNLVQKSDGCNVWNANLSVLSKHFYENIVKLPINGCQQFRGPVLFVAAQHSDFILEKDHDEILKLFPNAEFKLIKDSGHWIHNDKFEEFVEVCARFLNRPDTE